MPPTWIVTLPQWSGPRKIVLHGCTVTACGAMTIIIPEEADPIAVARMLEQEPSAVVLVDPSGDGR